MALVKETIVANESLSGLSEEQIGAIITLSNNSEDELFREKMGEHYRKLDASIEEHSGVKRNGDEKTYDYLPRAIDAMKATYDGRVNNLNNEITSLKATIAKGGDDALKAQLATVQGELDSTKAQFNSLKEEKDKLEGEYNAKLLSYRIDNEIAKAKDGIKFKGGLNEVALNALVAQAINNIKAKKPSFEVRGGEERLIFHDENGSPLNNAENKLNPFTAKELLIKEFESLDILDKRGNKGAGGGQDDPKPTILGAKSQSEATDLINKELASKGFAKGTSKFQEEFNRMWSENKISSLPLK